MVVLRNDLTDDEIKEAMLNVAFTLAKKKQNAVEVTMDDIGVIHLVIRGVEEK